MYPRTTRLALNQPYLFFLNTYFYPIMRLFGGIFLLFAFPHTPLFIISLDYFQMYVIHTSRYSGSLWCHASWKFYGSPYYDDRTLKYVYSWCIGAFYYEISSITTSFNLSLMYLIEAGLYDVLSFLSARMTLLYMTSWWSCFTWFYCFSKETLLIVFYTCSPPLEYCSVLTF